LLGPRDPVTLADEAWGIDIEAEVVVILGDVPMDPTRAEAENAIRLVMLVNDVTLRNVTPTELAKGFGFFHSKPSSAFTPVAVTPDELGKAWDGTKVNLPLLSFVNDQPLGRPVCAVDMTFDFPTLIMHAAKTRALCAGTILGAGTVSNRDPDGGPGLPIAEGGLGYSCIAEQRTVETIRFGAPKTPYLKFGDRVRIEMCDTDGHSIFGAIDQEVRRYAR
jgi:fumarylacetoacetate (FAA) hydrolase